MPSAKEYLNFVLEQLSDLDDIQYRAIMGEFVIYYRQKIIGGIYDDRFLIKPVKSAISMVLNPIYESPYEGGKAMILVEEVDDKVFLTQLITKMYEELPEPKKKKIKK